MGRPCRVCNHPRSAEIGRDLLHGLSYRAIAKQYGVAIKERVLAGLDYARKHGTKSGRAIGRPRKVFNRDQVRQLSAQGLSIRQIGAQLGLSRSTVSRTLEQAA
jgi:DNA invertase Pin-like site-specific DNA recombinase